eukprot:3488065-Alexandrium_andersonii.AAC.1
MPVPSIGSAHAAHPGEEPRRGPPLRPRTQLPKPHLAPDAISTREDGKKAHGGRIPLVGVRLVDVDRPGSPERGRPPLPGLGKLKGPSNVPPSTDRQELQVLNGPATQAGRGRLRGLHS